MATSSAASGPGLIGCLPFLRAWVATFPDCTVQNKVFVASLDGVLSSGALSRFAPNNSYWSGSNVMDPRSRTHWCERQYLKVVTLLNHCRRINQNETKYHQVWCLAGFGPQPLFPNALLPSNFFHQDSQHRPAHGLSA